MYTGAKRIITRKHASRFFIRKHRRHCYSFCCYYVVENCRGNLIINCNNIWKSNEEMKIKKKKKKVPNNWNK